MFDYDVKFSLEDVLERARLIRETSNDSLFPPFRVLKHEIANFSAVVEGATDFLGTYFLEKKTIQQELNQEIFIETKNAWSRIGDIYCFLIDMNAYCSWSKTNSSEEKIINDLLVESASNFLGHFNSFVSSLPLYKNKLSSDVSQKTFQSMNMAESNCNLIAYAINLEFSKDFKRDIFYLDLDLAKFASKYAQGTLRSNLDYFINDIPNIVSKQDYFRNVLFPLIMNVEKHAFNKINDINYRSVNNMEKKLSVSCVDAEDGDFFTLKVEDNGFGISKEIQDKIFNEGVSSTGGGFGLYQAKTFVENNGGKIWLETELGVGTSFFFTIPYIREETGYYYQ